MFMNLTKVLMMNSMIMGVIMSMSSNNWITMWTGMELGVLSIIPLMTQEKSSSDSPIKYFIIQSISSSLLIMGVMMMETEINFKMIILNSMLIKIGSAPFHMWLLSLIEGLEYFLMLMLFTVIKIPGLMTLSLINEQLQMWSIMCMLIGSTMMINQSSLKKVITYSSIYNLGVMMSSINENKIWMNFMIIYTMMMFMLTMNMKKMMMNYINQTLINENEYLVKLTFWILMMSMAGLPPMMGFSAKMMILEKMILKSEFLITMSLMLTSIISMLIYMRMTFLSMINQSTLNKWMKSKKKNFLMWSMVLNLTLTPIMLSIKNLT